MVYHTHVFLYTNTEMYKENTLLQILTVAKVHYDVKMNKMALGYQVLLQNFSPS